MNGQGQTLLQEELVARLRVVVEDERARVRRDEAEFHALNGARAVLEALERAGGLTDQAKLVFTSWEQRRGYCVVFLNGEQILPPIIPE